MKRGIAASSLAGVMQTDQNSKPGRWHAKGYLISIMSSIVMTLAIGLFFIATPGWTPPEAWQTHADFAVSWILLSYVWIQLGSLILVGAGTKNQMWIDALTSIVPLFLIVYVILQHYTGYIPISSFQIKTAWLTAYTMLLDVVIDLGLSVMLSRQVVEVGRGGVM